MTSTGEYWVGPIIGEGAFGQVHYCQHKTTSRPVAIKVIENVAIWKHNHHAVGNSHDQEEKRRQIQKGVLMERQILLELRESPHVANLLATFYDTQCLYFVFDLATGGDLEALIALGLSRQDYTSTTNEAKTTTAQKWMVSIPYYAWQLRQALDELHSKRIVHCDLKPANVLLTANGQVQLADFASSFKRPSPSPPVEASLQPESQSPIQSQHNTSDMVPRGTSQYSPPELIKGVQKDFLTEAVDLWSLGCTLSACFTGQSPFFAESEALVVQSIMRHSQEPSSSESGAVSDSQVIPPVWKELIDGLLQTDPSRRISMWRECCQPLENQSESQLQIRWQEEPPQELLLPQPKWGTKLDSVKLKDGAMGWGVFFL